MYSFILGQWVMGKITAEKVQSYVPKYIKQTQADEIVNTPQTGTLSTPQEEI